MVGSDGFGAAPAFLNLSFYGWLIMLLDQFGNSIVDGRVYGLGDRRSSLIPHDVSYDPSSDDVMVRKHGSSDPWRALYGQDTLLPNFCVLLDEDLMEVTEEPASEMIHEGSR